MSHDLPGPGPEYLDQGGGSPEPGEAAGGVRRSVWVGAAVVGAVGLAGGAAWAAMSLVSTGPQPAEALPADTLGYLSVDLDPTAGQKIEAIRTLKKFPALDEELGMGAEDDLRERLFELVQEDGTCADLEYGPDVAPWIGSRAAVAAVERDGKAEPVVLLAVEDAAAAEEAIAAIADCSSASGEPEEGWAVGGDWAVFAETRAVARAVVDGEGEGVLSDDDDFRRWTEEVGEPGIVTMYLAPGAGEHLADLAGDAAASGLEAGADPGAALDESTSGLSDFGGAAAVIRFADGAVELETAGDVGASRWANAGGDGGGEQAGTMPSDTVAALAVGLGDGWVDAMIDAVAGTTSEADVAEMLDLLERETGLALPEDLEAMAGDGVLLGVGPGLDLDVLGAGSDGTEVPVAVRVDGDPQDVERVLDVLRRQVPPGEATLLDSTAGDAGVAIGPDPEHRDQLAGPGGLGESEVFGEVLPDADRSNVVAFVDVDADDGWLVRMAGEASADARRNLEPLSAFGAAMWAENGVTHGRLRITTD